MKYFEFGRENPELMVMLHGGGICYRGAIPVAQELAKVYHVVLVAYDGFNPTSRKRNLYPRVMRQSGSETTSQSTTAGR